jgi:arabinose-5-phosphate isomerase
MDIKNIAKEVFKIESQEILKLQKLLTDDFEMAIKEIYNLKGKLIVSGMGKSGIIGKKIAATLASTGTPSFFLHPGEAYHGDLGMIEKDDIVLLLSNSGETDEVLKIIPFLKFQGNIIISITGNPLSTLSKNSNYNLNVHVDKEGCPLNLAPMSSTTATLVMGDAIAAALMKMRDFKDKDFARFHPGGSLGRRLLTKVEDVMHTQDLPICSIKDNIKEIVKIISNSKFGLVVVVDEDSIVGVITDGDIRRAMDDEKNFFDFLASDIMTKNPKTINYNAKLVDAQDLMTNYKINSLLITKDETLVGVVQIYDLGL